MGFNNKVNSNKSLEKKFVACIQSEHAVLINHFRCPLTVLSSTKVFGLTLCNFHFLWFDLIVFTESFLRVIAGIGSCKSHSGPSIQILVKTLNWLGGRSFFCFELDFTPCKTKQPLQGMEIQEKEAQKD